MSTLITRKDIKEVIRKKEKQKQKTDNTMAKRKSTQGQTMKHVLTKPRINQNLV